MTDTELGRETQKQVETNCRPAGVAREQEIGKASGVVGVRCYVVLKQSTLGQTCALRCLPWQSLLWSFTVQPSDVRSEQL